MIGSKVSFLQFPLNGRIPVITKYILLWQQNSTNAAIAAT